MSSYFNRFFRNFRKTGSLLSERLFTWAEEVHFPERWKCLNFEEMFGVQRASSYAINDTFWVFESFSTYSLFQTVKTRCFFLGHRKRYDINFIACAALQGVELISWLKIMLQLNDGKQDEVRIFNSLWNTIYRKTYARLVGWGSYALRLSWFRNLAHRFWTVKFRL